MFCCHEQIMKRFNAKGSCVSRSLLIGGGDCWRGANISLFLSSYSRGTIKSLQKHRNLHQAVRYRSTVYQTFHPH